MLHLLYSAVHLHYHTVTAQVVLDIVVIGITRVLLPDITSIDQDHIQRAVIVDLVARIIPLRLIPRDGQTCSRTAQRLE